MIFFCEIIIRVKLYMIIRSFFRTCLDCPNFYPLQTIRRNYIRRTSRSDACNDHVDLEMCE